MSERNQNGGDGRLTRSGAQAMRGERSGEDAGRVSNDPSSASAEERRRLLREMAVEQSILPQPPRIPGWHVCWLSTTNTADPIFRRRQMGYEPVMSSEFPEMASFTGTVDDVQGVITCREMVLFKIPEQTYKDLMTIFHHDMPNEEEGNIVEKLREAEVRDSSGKPLNEQLGQGFQEFAKSRQPKFET